jgi:hypothetical protein
LAYLETGDPDTAIEQAVTFAGYKVGAASDEEGYCSTETLRRMTEETFPAVTARAADRAPRECVRRPGLETA